MEIRQLEYFLMVSQAGSFTRAAERLFVSQPAVTNAVRSLEEELGIQLFDRGQKAVALTPEGKIFHAHIQQVMHGIASTIEEINAIKDLQDGRLNFGLTALGGLKSFVALLRDYHEQYPNIRMVMREGTETELLDELMDEHIDMVLLTRAPKNNAIASYKLPREEILVCCGRRHPLHKRLMSLRQNAELGIDLRFDNGHHICMDFSLLLGKNGLCVLALFGKHGLCVLAFFGKHGLRVLAFFGQSIAYNFGNDLYIIGVQHIVHLTNHCSINSTYLSRCSVQLNLVAVVLELVQHGFAMGLARYLAGDVHLRLIGV